MMYMICSAEEKIRLWKIFIHLMQVNDASFWLFKII